MVTVGIGDDFGGTLGVSFQGVTRRIPLFSILYIESNLRKITVHTEKEDYFCYRRLDEIEEELKGYGFIRCHQSLSLIHI